QVSAKDKATNKEQQIRIQASGGLSDADIETMVKEAEANAEGDKKRREAAEAKNSAESLIHATERSMADLGDDVPPDDKHAVERALADLKAALETDNGEEIKAKTAELSQVSMKLGEMAYRKAQEQNAGVADSEVPDADAPAAENVSDAEVIDADFTDLEVEDDDQSAKG
ncbi:MAG TPA: Hsp70 family protein, partial [Alphaproteobacteria bacterium]|nr:Hsp70 family protein [Alphaproteobacteria bacterium]